MPVDPNVFRNQHTFVDYQQAQDEFEQRKAMAAAQLQAVNARTDYIANKQPSFSDQVGQAAIRAAQGNSTDDDIALLKANSALHPRSNVAGLGLAPASMPISAPVKTSPMSSPQAANDTLGLFAPAPTQVEKPNFTQQLMSAPAPTKQGGVITLPQTEDFGANPYAGLNGSNGEKKDAAGAFVPAKLNGKDFLMTLAPDRANLVQLIGDGAEKSTTALARLPGAERQEVLSQVVQYNPKYSANQFKANADFGAGKLGSQIRSFNTSISHLETLDKLSDDLGNGDIKIFNRAAQELAAQTGQAAPINFDAAKQIVGAEIVKAIVGAGGGVAERQEAAEAVSRANSPEQIKGVIKTYQELMKGQLDNLKIQYKGATGKDDFEDKLSPAAQAVDHNMPETLTTQPTISKKDAMAELARREFERKKNK